MVSKMNETEIIDKIARNEIKMYQVERFTDNNIITATELRRKALEKKLNISLKHLSQYSIDMQLTASRNIENSIGCAQIPVGVVGPLKVRGEFANGEYYIPLCTTEGALVASVNRGCSLITHSGGANSRVLKSLMTRAPVMKVPDTEHAVKLTQWIKSHLYELSEVFRGDEPFLWLKDIQTWIIGRNVFIRFLADPADAMGMNMITKASRITCDYITKKFPWAKLVATSGNLCMDKKPNALNWILGRGKTVQAEVIVPRELVEKILKTTPEDFVEVTMRKLYIAGAQASAYGFNAHVANIIAALFLATGQDAAQVVESSMSIVTAEITDDGQLYVSITMPSLEIGTLGGGMNLPTQKECLSILECQGFDKEKPPGSQAKKLAEIFASAALAGELSLIGALASGHLVTAHERLGRGKKN